MADPREFVLIGSFKDGITPELQKINNELAKLKASFAGIGSRKNTGFRGATQEIGKLVSAHKKLSESVKGVEGDLRSTVGVLQQYRQEMGKAAAATRAFQKAGGSLGSRQFSQNMDSANKSAQEYLKTLKQINSESRRIPRGGRGGGFQPPKPPGNGGGYGGGTGGMSPPTPGRSGGGGGMGAHMGEFGFAYTLGSNIAQPIQNAIVAGFQIGVGLMTQPFQYFANAFGERVQDQISDLKAAGGLFSISKRSQTPFLNTIDEAIQYQQDTNRVFAKMAAALPGVTNDYVQVGKRLSDTMGRIAAGDFQNALQEANRIRATEEGRKFYGGAITGTGQEATKQVITTLLGEMTKKTTIAGLGGRSGAGGIAGAYGLPGLTERMLSQQEVSVAQFQRYAAVFSDPTIQDALTRNVDLINSTLPNTTARFKAMQKLLDEVVTPDLIEKLRTSVDGIYQGFRSAILDPDTGLFGLGRQFENFGYKINQYGEYVVDKEGKKIKDSLSIFEIVADIFSNAGQAILPLVDALPLVFDPLKKVASTLMDARHYAAEFNRTFNMYREGLKKLSDVKGNEFLKDSLDIRASLSAVSNFLYQFGVIGKGDFESIGKQLLSKKLNIGEMMKNLLDSVLNSKIAGEIGKTIGEIIGTVLTEVSKVTGFLSGRIASSSKLFEGLKKGFDAAGGTEAFKNIFKDVFMSLFNVLKEVLKILPLEAYFMAALAVVAPAAVQGLAMAFASRLWGGMQAVMNIAGQRMVDQLKKQAARFTRVQPVTVTDLGSVITDPRRMLPGTTSGAIVPASGAAGSAGIGAALARLLPILSKLTVTLTAIVMVGGGMENTLRQLSQFFSEVGSNLAGTFGGLFDLLGVLTGFVGDLGRRIGDLIGSLFGVKGEFDGLKIVLAPLTLALQLLSMGMRGLALAFAELRVFLARITGDKEYQQRIKERDELAVKLAQDQGRINAYNASMLGKENVRKQMNDAIYELQHSKTLKAPRSAELKSFVEESRKQLGDKTTPPPATKQEIITATQTQGINQKTSQQIKETTAVRTSTDAVKTSTEKTTQAVNNLAAKITSQTNLQTTVAAIYNLLASGSLRVLTNITIPPPGVNPRSPGNPNPTNAPLGGLAPSDPNAATIARRQGIAALQAKYRARGQQLGTVGAAQKYDAGERYKGGLGDAIASEMKHKPPGSDLVIANSSETVIPAAEGYGMKAFLDTLGSGFTAVKNQMQMLGQGIQTSDANSQKRDQQTNTKITDYHTQTQAQILKLSQNLSQLSTQVSSMGGMGGMGGGLFGAGMGGAGVQRVIAVGRMLQGMGLNVAENPAFGSGRVGQHAPGSYHYSGRAIDVTGSDAQLDAAYARLKAMGGYAELLWRTAGHYDHLHVAYAGGLGNAIVAPTREIAQQIDAKALGRANIETYTAGKGEFGGGTVGDIYVTVNAGATNDPDQLAYMVAERIQAAVGDAVNANILV